MGQSQITDSSPSATQDKSGADRWVGQWQITEPSSGQILKFVLTPEGKLLYLSPETSSGPIAYEIPVQKISDATTLPPNTQIVGFEQALVKGPQSEAKTYLGAMNRAQQAYYLENGKFGTTLEQLGVGIQSETENYLYKILPQSNQSVIQTAQAKNPRLKLRSYTGAVFVTKINDENITRAAICETDEPSSTLPAMPTPPKNASEQIQCPAGSHSLGK
ncbi:type IV pilin-like G/H family protein [Trichocoleus sp. FACHB-90]|uniref:type IV pilin-like G/H family protein n=1 Tax=Cyanophyceae TaxID=3028117 RepID=UPI0016871920|nr:type IV pilin-like G/H family protein [Trichocoleus sp. FACHB-90]